MTLGSPNADNVNTNDSAKRKLEPNSSQENTSPPLKKQHIDDEQQQQPNQPAALTKAEREAQRKAEKAAKEAERQAEKAAKEAERQAEKAAKEAERQAEKAAKEAERQAEKERKHAEKKAKEAERKAEKLAKEAERKAEKLAKEAERKAEKLAKEAEKKAAKEAEESKKKKSQPGINLFFKKTDTPAVPPAPEPVHDENTSLDYTKTILPFCARSNGRVFSTVVNCKYSKEESTMDPLHWLKSIPPLTPPPRISSQEFQSKLSLVSESHQIIDLLNSLHIKRLQFSHLSPKHLENPSFPLNEEYRPPYIGSTRTFPTDKLRELSINPLSTKIDDKQVYDYDSEAEWDQEDGEDLRDEDEHDSCDDAESSDLGEFLSNDDDEDEVSESRLKFVGPLVPVVISGADPVLEEFKAHVLVDRPINLSNPFNLEEVVKKEPEVVKNNEGESSVDKLMKFSDKVGGLDTLKSAVQSVDNSTATKALHIELMKQQFRNVTEKEIRQIFDLCLVRVGKKKAEKKWSIIPEIHQALGFQ